MFPFISNHGILGLNARNLLYIRPYNPKKAVAFADDKLKTKAFLTTRGIPTAKVYARIETREQARSFDFSQLPNECVLKPNEGFGGEGILVLKGRKKGMFIKGGKEPITNEELRQHIEDILEGMYSLGGRRDIAFFEQILTPHDCFAKFRPAGLPDIRIIVFNLVPVMAMVRIPTAASEGKANVHMGGIGIGIDLAKGMTTHAVQFNHVIQKLPHGGSPAGIQIPYWDEILLISSRIQQITNIGFLACDITIDQQMGPALLEVNARAGLMVQIANLAPLRSRLERVKGIKVSSPEKGVRIGQDLFGTGKKKEKVPASKPILGTRETIIINVDDTNIEVPCLIAPDRERTILSPTLVAELREKGALDIADEEEESYLKKFALGGKKQQSLVGVGDVPEPDRAIIGRRELMGFLIDPAKVMPQTLRPRRSAITSNLRATDRLIAQLDRDVPLLKNVKPLNLEQERNRARRDHGYNPLFHYAETEIDLDEVMRKLEVPVQGDHPMGSLLEKKRHELLARIELIRARGNTERFTQMSKALFGAPTSILLMAASEELTRRLACELPPPEKDLLSPEEAKALFEEALRKYSLHDWQVSVRAKLVTDCTVGNNRIYLREGATFAPMHVQALITHEIETHILTTENGMHQPFELFRRGTGHYLDTQEGLAVFNQNRIYGPFHEKRFHPARNVLGIAFALEHSFAETRSYLQNELGYDAEKALGQTIACKRGLADTSEPGGFTKGLVYYRGQRAIEQFAREGGDIRKLYIGKIAIEDLPTIEKMKDIEPPLLLPEFLRESVG